MATLQIHSIFNSISGECSPAFPQGTQVVIVRFQGCNLRCSYCDTRKSWDPDGGMVMTVGEVVSQIHTRNQTNVLITGGEPLFQMEGLYQLLFELDQRRYNISVETNGSLPVSHRMASFAQGWVVDYKLPGSGQDRQMMTGREMIKGFPLEDTIFKFVCTGSEDFQAALLVREDLIEEEKRALGGGSSRIRFAFSAALPIGPRELYRWMQEQVQLGEDLLNVQIHKWIFPEGEDEG